MRSFCALLSILLALTAPLRADAARDSADASLAYLRTVMDAYHTHVGVYDDVGSPGNHFHAYAKIPDAGAAVALNGSWTDTVHSGATAIRCAFTPPYSPYWAGFYFLNGVMDADDPAPQPNWGDVPDAGVDLTGATALTFWARGASGGEQIEFFLAGVGVGTAPHPDSAPRRPVAGTLFALTTEWQQFSIDLTGMDLSYVLGGFGWVASTDQNPGGAVFYLDDIRYELGPARLAQRLEEPRFLRSFTTLPRQPDPFDEETDGDLDFVARNLAFTYDNALALLAFLADGSADSIRRARLIGDALVYAARHDREYDGDRFRSGYAAGDIALPPGWTPNGRSGTVPIPGYYAESTGTFYEIEQEAIDTGNNAWAVIALRALYARTGDEDYRDAALDVAELLASFRLDSGTYQGFTGGLAGGTPRPWASTEHNLDLHAAFKALYAITSEAGWLEDANHARQFVDAMWDPALGCYRSGTIDPSTRNEAPGKLALDAQTWAVLALQDVRVTQAPAVACAEQNHLTAHDGFSGADFNEDLDGVWFEGTAQLSLAYWYTGRKAGSVFYAGELQRAQQQSGPGLLAATVDGLSTGFDTAANQPFKYFRRLHVGATAWNVFAQLRFNPYTATTRQAVGIGVPRR